MYVPLLYWKKGIEMKVYNNLHWSDWSKIVFFSLILCWPIHSLYSMTCANFHSVLHLETFQETIYFIRGVILPRVIPLSGWNWGPRLVPIFFKNSFFLKKFFSPGDFLFRSLWGPAPDITTRQERHCGGKHLAQECDSKIRAESNTLTGSRKRQWKSPLTTWPQSLVFRQFRLNSWICILTLNRHVFLEMDIYFLLISHSMHHSFHIIVCERACACMNVCILCLCVYSACIGFQMFLQFVSISCEWVITKPNSICFT